MKNLYLCCIIALFFVFLSCNNDSSPDIDNSLPKPAYASIPPPVPLIFKVEKIYPHDPSSFTQGLEFYKGKLYEGTGEFGQSKLRIIDLNTGVAEKSFTIPDPTVFGEGITILNGKIYQLTWQNNKIFEYNLNDITKPIRTFHWNSEGWGATNNGKEIIISDGSSNLYFTEPDEKTGQMKIIKVLKVMSNTGPVDSLNELELINGDVYANRWMTDIILRIDTANGHVKGVMNLKGLLKQYAPAENVGDEAVLNGIAYDSATKKIFITGKDWPKLFAITLTE